MISVRLTLTTPAIPLSTLDVPHWRKCMALLDDIIAKISALTTVDDSVIALLTDLKAKLDAAIANGADPAKLQQISDALGTEMQRLSDAVTTNTTAA
jgi:hypothetical protein